MRLTTHIGLTVLVLCLVAGSAITVVASRQDAPAFQASLVLSDSQLGLNGPSIDQINLVHIRDLWIRVHLLELTGVVTEDVQFVNPQGLVFYHDAFHFSPEPAGTGTIGTFQGYEVFPATLLNPGYALDHSIPIAGSVFERYPDPGLWHVNVTVDGIPGTLSQPLEIIIRR